MLVPELEKSIIQKKKTDKDNNVILEVDPEKYADFRDLYSDILQEDDKALDSYIKYIEKLVRKSFEYNQYIGILRNEFDIHKCAFFKNLDFNDMKKTSMEFHHYPLTLYDIVFVVYKNRLDDYQSNMSDMKKFNDLLNPFSIAKEVLKLHYEGKIGLVPLALTPHELFHNGNLFIPLCDDYVFGNYNQFVDDYNVKDIGNYGQMLDLIKKRTYDIMNGKEDLNLEKLTIKKVYLDMGIEGMKKISREEDPD